ncbi:hypothetical protein C8J56DRAFT_477498 [Mycena floridula]|nr:hypothetical protein C8J56DRAFT_477498 [Mycena floridula]
MVSVVLDDTDPSIQYSGNDWVVGGGPGEFMGTTHGTVASDSEIKIPFSGTAIQVYGTVTATGGAFPDPISTYSIDNGPATFFSLNSTGLTSNPTMMCFFNSPPLSDGNHTLNICSTVAGSRFWFDFAVYTVGPGSAASISTSTGATTSNSPGKLSVKPGQIVGGALGLFLMTVLLCSTIFYCYLRRKRHGQCSLHSEAIRC